MTAPYTRSAATEDRLLTDSNKFSCNECKRRRMKCSREVPVCASCLKYRRHCLYEKNCKTPLTRKHLTEVEEELNIVKQLLMNYISDVELSSLLQKVRNGSNISDVPEFSAYLDKVPQKRKKLVNEGPDYERNNLNRTTDNQGRSNLITTQTSGNVRIESLLIDDNSDHNESNNLDMYQKCKLQQYGIMMGEGDFQIPQLLPSSVNVDEINPNDRQIRKKNFKGMNLQQPSSSSNFDWDERNRLHEKTQTSVIDGKATTEESGSLGTVFSSAVINLVGNGFFLHDTRVEGHKIALRNVSEDSKHKLHKQRIENYIELYFETYHISYPIIHKPTFMAQLNEIIPRPEPYWESLYYIVAAIGSFMSATSQQECDDLELFDSAKSKLSIDVLETGNITLVQTLTLMSNYLQKRDRPNSGYNYLGLAVRMALGLRLHRQIDDSDESILDQEMKRRIWWCLYIFDCGQTIGYGRPLGIPCAGIDTRLPLNILDSNLTALSVKFPDEEEQPTILTSVRLQSLFHLLTNSIYERIITDPFPSAKLLLDWDKLYLERWQKLIPKYFKKEAHVILRFKLAQFVLEWRYRNLKIIMFRTFLLKRVILDLKTLNEDNADTYESQAADLCLKECGETITSMAKFWEDNTRNNRMEVWYTLYFLIPAVLMPLVCLRNDPTSTSAEYWRSDVISAQKIIQKLTKICPAASQILDLISILGRSHLTNQVHEADNSNNPIPSYSHLSTDESPLSQLNQLHEMLWPMSFDIDQQFLQ